MLKLLARIDVGGIFRRGILGSALHHFLILDQAFNFGHHIELDLLFVIVSIIRIFTVILASRILILRFVGSCFIFLLLFVLLIAVHR